MNGRLDLCGNWNLKWADGERGGLPHHRFREMRPDTWMTAEVPGEVHLDLVRQGWIDEPANGLGVLHCRWVEELYWSYRRDFELPSDVDPRRERIWLHFEGLDYDARIFLNGTLAGTHANSFSPCRLEVTGLVRAGKNVLTVSIEGGLYHVAEKSTKGYYGASDGEHDVDELLHKRIWLRKPQSSFGWDWAPRLVNVGITGRVWLEWSETIRADQLVVLAEPGAAGGTGKVRLRWFVEGVSTECRAKDRPVGFPFGVPLHLRDEQESQAEATRRKKEGRKGLQGFLKVRIRETGEEFQSDVEILEGMHPLEMTFELSDIRLWWPAGQGNQPLYTLEATLWVGHRETAVRTRRFGFRSIRIDQSSHPDGGRFFVVEVNGRRVFAKGADFVPADILFARVDRARYEVLTDRALELNFNLLRVWGGGLYESDDFYDLCDEKGILVWQEFIFACAAYPIGDRVFLDNVKEEAVHQIRRLSAHPSLVAWCGNNEQEWHTWNQSSGISYPDHALYHMILPRLLQEEDPTRYYQASSPLSPDLGSPNEDSSGDQHPWQVGFANTDFREYRKMSCRFPNEGGVLGPSSLPALHAALPEGQRTPYSFAWQLHDNGVEQWYPYSVCDDLLQTWTGRDTRELTLEEYSFLGGFVQGEGLREYIENFRRRMYDSAAAVFWMFNDCWPTTRSWTPVDCFGNRNPCFHAVRRAFAPVHVVLACPDGIDVPDASVVVYGVNDTPLPVTGTLRCGAMRFDSQTRSEEVLDVVLAAGASTRLASFPVAAWRALDQTRSAASGASSDAATVAFARSAAFALLADASGRDLARGRLIQPRFRELDLRDEPVSVRREGGEIVFECPVFTLGVCLDLEGREAIADNFFDLWPGVPHRIDWPERRALPSILFTANSMIRRRGDMD
jgi:beta-mannosidase